jgi:Flp pilus assembly protein TadD
MSPRTIAVAALAVIVVGLGAYKLTRPVDHAAEGFAALKAGHNHVAIDELRLAVVEKPREAELHYDLGSAYENVGWLDQAVPEFDKAIELDPKNPAFREGVAKTKSTLAYRAMQQGKPADAVKLLQAAMALSPDDPVILYNLALSLQKLGRVEEANRANDRANQLDPAHRHQLPGGG